MTNELNTLQLLKDNLSMASCGMTKEEAHRLGICIQCRQKIVETTRESNKPGGIYSIAGHQEYGISGMCEYCFDELFLGTNRRFTMCYGMGCPWENHNGECTKPLDMPCEKLEEGEEEEDLLPDDEDALVEYVNFLLKLGEQ